MALSASLRLSLLLALGTSACALARPPVAAPPPPGPYRYEVHASPGGRELEVSLAIPAGPALSLGVEDDAEPFVHELEYSTGGPYLPLRATSSPLGRGEGYRSLWQLPACPAAGCRLRYRFTLEQAAAAIDNENSAALRHGVIMTSPSTWLLHPVDPNDEQGFFLRVVTPAGTRFVSGLLPAPTGEDNEYAAHLSDLPRAPYSAFGDLRIYREHVAGARLDIARLPGPMDLPDENLVDAVTSAARLVSEHYRRPPIARTLVLLIPEPGRGVGFARVLGNGGASVIAPIGAHSSPADIRGWEIVHEMLHVAFPNLLHQQAWLEEGMATYYEPLLRARAGLISEEQVFAGFLRGMPHGLPRADDRGLDNTPTWGRTYWGGALFCLLADLEIRERTRGKRSLDDVLRTVLTAGGNVASRWSIDRLLQIADASTSVPVLRELYEAHALRATTVDLEALWAELGVRREGDRVVFDERAPKAWLRRALVAPGPRITMFGRPP